MAAEDFGRFLGQMWRRMLGKPVYAPQPKAQPTAPLPVAAPAPISPTAGEVESDWRLSAIPAGFQIYEARIEVAGLHYRREDALCFIRSQIEHHLEFERDPMNPYDTNAIKVIGVVGSTRYHLGFVPADTAKQLVSTNLISLVQARLERAYAGSNDYVQVIFQVIGPKTHRQAYRDFLP